MQRSYNDGWKPKLGVELTEVRTAKRRWGRGYRALRNCVEWIYWNMCEYYRLI